MQTEKKLKNKAKITVRAISLLAIGLIVGYYVSYFIEVRKTKVLQTQVDSLTTFIDEPERIHKTLTIAYPYLAKIYGRTMYYWALLIHVRSVKKELPWFVVAGKIYIETEFDPTKVNRKTECKGLMQLKEGKKPKDNTAKMVFDSLKIQYVRNKTVFNDIACFLGGTEYLKWGYLKAVKIDSTKIRSKRLKYTKNIHNKAAYYYVAGAGWPRKKARAVVDYMNRYSFQVVTEGLKLKAIYDGLKRQKKHEQD